MPPSPTLITSHPVALGCGVLLSTALAMLFITNCSATLSYSDIITCVHTTITLFCMYNSNTCCNDNIATCIYLSSVATLIWLAQIFLLCLEIYCGLDYTKEKDLFNDHNQLRKREWGKYGIYVPPVVLFTDASRGTGILDIVVVVHILKDLHLAAASLMRNHVLHEDIYKILKHTIII